jgi:hypothetical protein
VQLVEDAGRVPVAQASPAGHAGAAVQFRREVFPRDAGPHHEQDAAEDRPVIGRRPAASSEPIASPSRGRVRRQQRLNDLPQLVRHQWLRHRALLGNELS